MTAILPRPAEAFRYEDLEAIPDDGYRREIIGGTLIVSPSPNLGHQRASVLLTALLLSSETPESLTLAAPFDWRTPDGGVVEPDLLVVRRSDADPNTTLPPSATPLLVIEILSPSNRLYDLSMKRALYEQLGIPAYWIVDTEVPSILALRLAEGRYATEAEVTGDDEFATDWPFPVRVVPATLLT